MVNVKSPDLGSLTRTVQAIRQCWEGGVRPILGGSCTDTDVSARAIANVALGAGPAWVLARPGMGIDEGFQIVHNECAGCSPSFTPEQAAESKSATPFGRRRETSSPCIPFLYGLKLSLVVVTET